MQEPKVNLLIVGPPRSGTSLIAAMISRHSDAAIIFEPKNMVSDRILSKKIVGQKLCIPNQIELRDKNTLKKRILVNRLLNVPVIKIIAIKYKYPLANFSIEDHLSQGNSKIIGLIRDGNDVIGSIMRRGEQTFAEASYRWSRAIEVIHNLIKDYNDKVLLMSFENIVQNPEKYLKTITEFINVSYEPEMLEGYKYTPIYHDSKGIDKNKAYRSKNEKIDFNLEDKFPKTMRKYRYLKKHC
ncbi:MAG: hypothetical protein GF313_13870 [Caldithrix sp.]|nr:hypothetical protein [Caldithrix sp.]